MRPRVPYIVNDFSFADVAAIVEAKLKEKTMAKLIDFPSALTRARRA